MNPLLQLRGQLHGRSRANRQNLSLPKGSVVSSTRIAEVADLLRHALAQWPADARCKDVLLEVHYDRIVPKSRRLKRLLHATDEGHGIVGARYETPSGSNDPRHVITYYVPRELIEAGIRELGMVEAYVREKLGGEVTGEAFGKIGRTFRTPSSLNMTAVKQLICDCLDVADVTIPRGPSSIDGPQIVNIFKTDVVASDLLGRFDAMGASEVIDDTTFLLDPADYANVFGKAPYLVSMTVDDEYNATLECEDEMDDDWGESRPTLPPPSSEPIVGVIDTLFDTNCYLAPWVEYSDELPEARRQSTFERDYEHGTSVTSLIVDGPRLNPELDDGCGRFRVRHFGVAQESGNSQRRLMADIERIVTANPRIHVWNLSLGTKEPSPRNFISPLGALLDRLQAERPDVLFVVAGTNAEHSRRGERVGCPADSLNSIVVNSVGHGGRPSVFSRRGPVLSFFNKPDVAAVGGDLGDPIRVFNSGGIYSSSGTSLAAPWITRKAAYLMEVVGLPRDIAKALIVNSAIPWGAESLEGGVSPELGYGIVPRHIRDVLESPDDEIRFFISDIATSYYTSTYELPVPRAKDRMPYKARIVLSYAPRCDRTQGVDYTLTELSAAYGPLGGAQNESGKAPTIKGIANAYTHEPLEYPRYEGKVRDYGRKWDNLKVRTESCGGNDRGRELKAHGNRWGLKLEKMTRLEGAAPPQRFGAVLTLKAVDHRNRIEDFLDECRRYGWRVTEISLSVAQEIDEKGRQDIKWS